MQGTSKRMMKIWFITSKIKSVFNQCLFPKINNDCIYNKKYQFDIYIGKQSKYGKKPIFEKKMRKI